MQTPCDPNSNADHLMCQTIAEDCSAYCAPRGETLPDGSYLEGLCSNSTEGDEIPCATNHVNMTYSHVCRRDPNYMNPEALPFGMHEDENDQIQKVRVEWGVSTPECVGECAIRGTGASGCLTQSISLPKVSTEHVQPSLKQPNPNNPNPNPKIG